VVVLRGEIWWATAALFHIACCLPSKDSSAADIRHYDLYIAPNFSTGAIDVRASVKIDNPQLERTFSFGLNDRYDSVSVSSAGAAVTTERGAGSIAVTVDRLSRELTLTFELAGNLGRSNDENRAVVADSSVFLLWSDRFYPIAFDDRATVTTTVVLPADFQVVASGVPTASLSIPTDGCWRGR
jgi:hypothetical protein